MYGDSKGEVNMLLCSTREWPARDLVSTDEHQDYLTVHKEHTDWISQVRGCCWVNREHSMGVFRTKYNVSPHVNRNACLLVKQTCILNFNDGC